jgi:hypothetical protein
LTRIAQNRLADAMSDPHESERYLIAYTRDKIRMIDDMCVAFAQRSGHRLVEDLESEPGSKLLKIKLGPIPPPVRGLAAESLTNMRNALDQAVLHCSERINAAARRKAPKNGCHFPFADSADEMKKLLGGGSWRVRDIAPELHPTLQSFAPYPSKPGEPGNDRLHHVGLVSGPNKHKLTLRVGSEAGPMLIRRIQPLSGHGFDMMAPRLNPATNEIAVVRTHVDGQILIDFDLEIYVGFEHKLIGNYPIAGVLIKQLDTVEKAIETLIGKTDEIVAELSKAAN